ncbi:hypothetical protein ACHMW5_02550 [Azospirillum melinis]|uniref:hypothetical protein n=1 Tax=Azospirillum melinis TaxID=328839 RepID=UPI003757BA94
MSTAAMGAAMDSRGELRPTLAKPRQSMMLEAVKGSGGFDVDVFHVMEERDNKLIADEVLHGSLSSAFVYDFEIQGTRVAGVSVVGARHLASFYGGIKHRIIATVQKTGALFTFTSYPHDGMPMLVNCAHIHELAEEDDFYNVVIEITDIKTGNSIQAEARETRWERKRNGDLYQRPNFQKIAQSKAYRNGVLAIIPQDVITKFKLECLSLGKGVSITDNVIDEKRSNCLRFAATKGLSLDRRAVDALTFDQISGLAMAVKDGDGAFANACKALGLIGGEPEPAQIGEKPQQQAKPAKPPAAKPKAEPKPEPKPAPAPTPHDPETGEVLDEETGGNGPTTDPSDDDDLFAAT